MHVSGELILLGEAASSLPTHLAAITSLARSHMERQDMGSKQQLTIEAMAGPLSGPSHNKSMVVRTPVSANLSQQKTSIDENVVLWMGQRALKEPRPGGG